jgi:ubiquitin-protein ligase
MGLQHRPEETWRFQPIGSEGGEPTLLLARDLAAAAQDPRADRLKTERLRLEQMNQESDWVRAKPVNVLPGSEPEQYEITLRCRGISGIDASKNPIYLDVHKVLIICDEIWPSSVPRLKWLTPIWHPNIQHAGDKAVCVNRAEWLGGMYLVDLCRMLFEMAQYRNYHAEFSRPYPLDQQAAKWVLTHAEPEGIVDKKRGVSTDNKHFERPTQSTKIKLVGNQTQKPATSANKVQVASSSTSTTTSTTTSRVQIAPASQPKPEPARRISIVGKKE